MSVRSLAHFARKLRFKTTIGKSGFGCFLGIFIKPRASSVGQKAGQNGVKPPKSVLYGDPIGTPRQNTLKTPKNTIKSRIFGV